MIANLLNDNAATNQAGLMRTIYFALAADVATWAGFPAAPATYADLVTHDSAFVMASTKQFFSFEATVRKSGLSFEAAGERGSKSSINRLEIIKASLSASMLGFLEAHQNDEMVFICKDLDGEMRVLGTETLPAMIESYSGATGADVTDGKETQIVIESVGKIATIYTSQTVPLTPAV
jgi:hypothetical protein